MRKKTLDEKIQEELKYSEYLNNKINQISKKAKDKKKQIKRNQNTFDYINEFKRSTKKNRKRISCAII